MKYIISAILLLFTLTVLSQNNKEYRSQQNREMRTLLPVISYSIYMTTYRIESILDDNKHHLGALENPSDLIDKLNSQIQEAKKENSEPELTHLLDSICVSCYKYEYDNQILLSNDLSIKAQTDYIIRKSEADSLALVEKADTERRKTDAKNILSGYNGFKFHLDGMSPKYLEGCVTPFIGVDVGFASTRFAIYVINNTSYTIDEYCSYESGNKITHCFVPKIQLDKNEKFTITYTFKVDKSKLAYIQNTDCRLITNVLIQGNTDILLDLFIRYWQTKIKVGNKIGSIANCRFMGDFISLSKLSQSSMKINISKNPNVDMDYYKMFDIK